MTKPTVEDLQSLMTRLILPLYKVERTAVVPFKPRRFENDAEHSWSLAFLACSLAPEIDRSLDIGKIAQFAIIHDIIEIFAGDTSPWDNKEIVESKQIREEKAMEKIEKEFSHFPWIIDTLRQYDSKSSKEARFIWAVDKIIILLFRILDNGRYFVDTKISKELFYEGIEKTSHRKKAHTHPDIGEYYDQLLELIDKKPDFFYRAAADSSTIK